LRESETVLSELYEILKETPPVKVLLLALDMGEWDCERSLAELAALCEANHMEAAGQVVQKRAAPEAATMLGSGKVDEARLAVEALGAEAAVFDGELTGSQLRNLSGALHCEVIDRTMLILEIFRSRAVTNEGKLQTELADLRYRLPRLSGAGTALSRQGGGGAGGGGARRGAGETKLELDKRHVRDRIDMLGEKLDELEKRRGELRRARSRTGMPVVSLVGYTNVGKSSLLNALCGAQVLEADMLFATLDPTSRKLTLPSGLSVLLVDTVGFVSRLPHHLVEAFKSTLEEAAYSDVIVRVADACDPLREQQLAVTDEVLESLGCGDIPQLTVYNKCDRAGAVSFDPDILLTSAKTGQGLPALLEKLDALLADRVRTICVLLPYDKVSLAAPMRARGSVTKEEYRPEGLYLEGVVRAEELHRYEPYLV
jgi:GTP-binding protein HflX